MLNNNYKVAVVGSRSFNNYQVVSQAVSYVIDNLFPDSQIEIVSGGALGVDSLARRFAKEKGYLLTEMKPNYQHNNDRTAPLRRNIEIANYCDYYVAIWDGESTGTKHILDHLQKLGKPGSITYI